MKNISVIIMLSVLALVLCQFLILPTNSVSAAVDKETSPENKAFTPVEVHRDNWFDFVNEYLDKYTDATVIDVNTLITYNVERVGGYNHADVEPLTADDTANFYKIYGNEWSWTRRPVWVKYGDRYIAASINGYPHSYDLVSGNNMTGHSCIHFYMSRTHGSNNLDFAHQEAVAYAYNNQQKLNDYLLTLSQY